MVREVVIVTCHFVLSQKNRVIACGIPKGLLRFTVIMLRIILEVFKYCRYYWKIQETICAIICAWPMAVVHAKLECTSGLGLLCMPNLHTQHKAYGCCACQIGMHNNPKPVQGPRPVVHAQQP
jgi:hypothetical protein